VPNRPARNVSKPSVAIIGAGVIGLGIAWRLAVRGVSVAVFDKGVSGAGASHAAAGMLAACAEAEPGEEALVTLGRVSQARWPAFAAELKQASGVDVGLRPEGTLVVALTSDGPMTVMPGAAARDSSSALDRAASWSISRVWTATLDVLAFRAAVIRSAAAIWLARKLPVSGWKDAGGTSS